MRHIMIGLFASSLGHGCTSFMPTTSYLTTKTNPRHFIFTLKTIYSLGRFKKGDLIRIWRQGPGISVRAYSLIPLLLQSMPNFAKMLTSHDAHFIVIIFFPLSTSRKRSYIHSRAQPHSPPTRNRQSLPCLNFTSIWGRSRRRCTGKRGLFYIKESVYGKGPW